MKVYFSFIAILLTASCRNEPSAPGDIYVSGEYFYNFEYSHIIPDGKDVLWCVEGDMSKAQLPEGWGMSYVTVQGKLGPKGRYGNLGSCEHVFTLSRIIKISNMRGRD